jgi:hypothetical protein
MQAQPPSSLLDGKYGLTVKPDSSDRLAIEIGDTKQPGTFYPQVKAMRWDNEVNLSFRLVDGAPGVATTVVQAGNVVKWQKGDVEAHFYDRGDSADHPEGAFELEVLIKRKPASNVVRFSMQTKGLEFLYQPALTQAQIDAGHSCPENVVGSYAVYHATKSGDYSRLGGNNYRTGKVCHIFRPQAVDANGITTWADLNIDAAALTATITVPQAFLDSAAYPVLVDPTFGWSSVGGTQISLGTGYIYAPHYTYTPASNGVIQSITAYASGLSTAAKFAIYNGSGLVDYANVTLPNGWSWVSGSAVLGGSVGSGTPYILALMSNYANNTLSVDFVSGGENMYYVSSAWGPFPDPITWAQRSGWSYRFSIYATYAEILNITGSGAARNAGGAAGGIGAQVFSGAGTSSSRAASAGAAAETFLGVGTTSSGAGACSGIGSIADIVGSGACATRVACFGSGTYTPLAILGSGACASLGAAAGTGTEIFAGSGLGENSTASHGTGIETFAGSGSGLNTQRSSGRVFVVQRVYQWPKRVFA